MKNKQLTIWDINPLNSDLSTNDHLEDLVKWSFNVFSQLDPSIQYQLAFSGGKDSHVLLGVYLAWCEFTNRRLNLSVVFSDTWLESPQLYKLIDKIIELCNSLNINFVRVEPEVIKSFWVKLIGLGYPVPNHKNRWCTQYLKIQPMNKLGAIPIAGSHAGESTKRDQRLKNCGSSECGIDKLENKIEPLANWQNCDIWDWIILKSDELLYQGISQNLLNLYDISESTNGSLRMGCFMCPVVVEARIVKQINDGIIPPFSIEIRKLIEELRNAPRLNSPRTKKAGATLVDSRIIFWQKIQPYMTELKRYGWITLEVEQIIDKMLKDRTYPPTYKTEWIAEQEPLAKSWNIK